MNEKVRILTVGTSYMNFSMNIYKMPLPGESLTDDGGTAFTPGGAGADAAVCLSRLGADCIFATKLGADVHGQTLYGYYNSLGINTKYVKVDHDRKTGLCVVIKEGDGTERSILYPGANSHITAESMAEAFYSQPDALYLGFDLPFDTALSAARFAASKNIPIFIDPSPAKREYELELLPMLEIFCPNEKEVEEYTGIAPTTMENALRASLALYRRVKCKYIVIKQGARGAFLYDGKHYNVFPTMRVDKALDTAGSSNAFTAALTIEYLRSRDIRSAIKHANAAGAITVTRKGGISSVPTSDEVQALLRSDGQ